MNKTPPTVSRPVIASPEGLQLPPLPDLHASLDIHIPITTTEMENVRRGHIPEEMDDRWFIYVDENDTAHIHRSWTGFCIYKIKFKPQKEGWAAVHMAANRNPEEYTNTNIEHDKDMVKNLLLQHLVRNRQNPMERLISYSSKEV